MVERFTTRRNPRRTFGSGVVPRNSQGREPRQKPTPPAPQVTQPMSVITDYLSECPARLLRTKGTCLNLTEVKRLLQSNDWVNKIYFVMPNRMGQLITDEATADLRYHSALADGVTAEDIRFFRIPGYRVLRNAKLRLKRRNKEALRAA